MTVMGELSTSIVGGTKSDWFTFPQEDLALYW